MSDPYTNEVRALFAAPAHAGDLEATATGEAGDPEAHVSVAVRLEAGRIVAMRFLARGCPHLIAAAEAACAALEGKNAVELREFSADGIRDRLAVPAEKTGRILLLEDAIRALGRQPDGTHDLESSRED